MQEKLNGRLVMTWIPSLSGKSLGLALNYFKLELGEKYQEIILESTEEQIKKRFMKFYEQKK